MDGLTLELGDVETDGLTEDDGDSEGETDTDGLIEALGDIEGL
jgi:hypothetical protein